MWTQVLNLCMEVERGRATLRSFTIVLARVGGNHGLKKYIFLLGVGNLKGLFAKNCIAKPCHCDQAYKQKILVVSSTPLSIEETVKIMSHHDTTIVACNSALWFIVHSFPHFIPIFGYIRVYQICTTPFQSSWIFNPNLLWLVTAPFPTTTGSRNGNPNSCHRRFQMGSGCGLPMRSCTHNSQYLSRILAWLVLGLAYQWGRGLPIWV